MNFYQMHNFSMKKYQITEIRFSILHPRFLPLRIISFTMVKFLTVSIIFGIFSYGLCLSCYRCTSFGDCRKPEVRTCRKGETYCVALGKPNILSFYKGCDDRSDRCQAKNPNGELAYPQCQQCEEDLCNDLQFIQMDF